MVSDRRPRVVIVGGGYTGAAVAVQLANATAGSIAITIIEPRAELGRGLAYSTTDPDHRLNAPVENHLLDPAFPNHLPLWCDRQALLARDPDALASNRGTYIRRGEFGTYVASAVAEHACIRHRRARAVSLARRPLVVTLDDGAAIEADMVVLATGNGPGRWPSPFSQLPPHPALIADPFEAERLHRLRPDARVLLLGSGLTALDVVSTLLRRGHTGPVVSISRHGVRPREHRAQLTASLATVLAAIEGPVPEYAEAAMPSGSVGMSRALRARIAESAGRGVEWQVAFDELRNVVWRFWPGMAVGEKRRFLRHLRAWYDAHRFRVPPQNAALVREGERLGIVTFKAARLREAALAGTAVRTEAGVFDAVVNCAGLNPDCGASSNPFLAQLLAAGLIRRDPCGFGFEVDADCRPLKADGEPLEGVRMAGPPTAGTFGDPLGAIFIAPQVRRMLPALLAEMGVSPDTH